MPAGILPFSRADHHIKIGLQQQRLLAQMPFIQKALSLAIGGKKPGEVNG